MYQLLKVDPERYTGGFRVSLLGVATDDLHECWYIREYM